MHGGRREGQKKRTIKYWKEGESEVVRGRDEEEEKERDS